MCGLESSLCTLVVVLLLCVVISGDCIVTHPRQRSPLSMARLVLAALLVFVDFQTLVHTWSLTAVHLHPVALNTLYSLLVVFSVI